MRKAQASTDFLFTYGWAILIVLSMIGGLAYLGVLDPANLLPDKCFFNAGITCRDQAAIVNGGNVEIHAILVNSFGAPIILNNNPISMEDLQQSGCECAGMCNLGNNYWESDKKRELIIQCNGDVTRVSLNIQIKYKLVDGIYDRVVGGSIQAMVR